MLGPVAFTGSTDPAGESEEEEAAENESGTDAAANLIRAGPLQREEIIEEPVTSGSDGLGEPN